MELITKSPPDICQIAMRNLAKSLWLNLPNRYQNALPNRYGFLSNRYSLFCQIAFIRKCQIALDSFVSNRYAFSSPIRYDLRHQIAMT